VVTICSAQWSLYAAHSGHYMYRSVVTICTASLTFTILHSAHTAVFMCFVWISEQTAIISLYNINRLVCITGTVCLLRGTDWGLIMRLICAFGRQRGRQIRRNQSRCIKTVVLTWVNTKGPNYEYEVHRHPGGYCVTSRP
jgi:hypothetical protein